MINFPATTRSLVQWEAAIERMVREQPDFTEAFEICLVSEGGRTNRETLVFPSWKAGEKLEKLVKYCAAHINNLTMTLGGIAVDCRCTKPELVVPVLQEVESCYPQVKQVLSEYYGCDIPIRHVQGPISFHKTVRHDIKPSTTLSCMSKAMTAVGINIGQTMTKLIATKNNEELTHTRMNVLTWDDNKGRSFAKLFDKIVDILRNFMLMHELQKDVEVIGISIGGIVRDGYITSHSGIASQMSEYDFKNLRNLADLVQERFGVVTLLTQDVIAKAHAIRMRYPSRCVLVLDLGTSTGGAFIAADGTIPGYLNQVGRVVIDLSKQAISRDDGQAKGILSKYLSFTGYARFCKEYGLENQSREAIVRLIDANSPEAIGLLDRLSKTLIEAVTILVRYYDAEIVVLTGGLVQGEFGSRLLRDANRCASDNSLPLPLINVSTNPKFEGAVGSAYMAADHYH